MELVRPALGHLPEYVAALKRAWSPGQCKGGRCRCWWQPGTSSLPAHVLGHIGYAVVPWRAGLGYAKLALRLMLHRVQEEGLEYVEITMDPENIASRKVVEANGGVLLERFQYPVQYGGKVVSDFELTFEARMPTKGPPTCHG